MADDATPETLPPRTIKIRPDRRAIAIQTDFVDDPNQAVQSYHFIDGTQVGFKTAAQVADWDDV